MTAFKYGNATNILNIVESSSWWMGRVKAMRQRNGKQFGVLRQDMTSLLKRRIREEKS